MERAGSHLFFPYFPPRASSSCSPYARLRLIAASQVQAHTLVGCPGFAAASQGTPLDHGALLATGLMLGGSLRTVYICIFSKPLPEGLASNLPESQCCLSSSLWNTDVSESLQLLGATKNKIGHLDSHKGLRDNQEPGQG